MITDNIDTGKIAKVRSFGFFMKGVVYIILGTLTFMAAFGLGGDVSNRTNVIKFLLDLPLGKALIGIASLGLFAYSLWRFYQTLKRPKKKGDDNEMKSVFKRIRYFYSGLLYGTIAFSFAKPLISVLSGNGEARVEEDNNGDEKAALWELLSMDWGKALLWVLAAIIAGQALQQFFIAYTASFMKKIDNYPSVKHEYDFIKKSGRMGYFSRGVVFGILAFFIVEVILQHNANAYKGTEGALQYLLTFSYGTLLLGAVALGLILYGIFNVMVARNANLTRLT
jgi:hypothetical protein